MKRAQVVIKRLLHVLMKRLNLKDIDRDTQHMLMGAMGSTSITIQNAPTRSSQQTSVATRTSQPSQSSSKVTIAGSMFTMKAAELAVGSTFRS